MAGTPQHARAVPLRDAQVSGSEGQGQTFSQLAPLMSADHASSTVRPGSLDPKLMTGPWPSSEEESAMTMLTRKDVIAVLGPVDDDLILEIIGTGATQTELAEAYTWLRSDEALMNEGRPLPSGRVGALVDILQTSEETEEREIG